MLSRRLLYALAVSQKFERAARALPPVERALYRRARRYVAGATLTEAVLTVERLSDEGLAASLDFFGENETDPTALSSVVAAYKESIKALPHYRDVYLEVVPSHLGLDVSPDIYRRHVEQILEMLPEGWRLHLSAEESHRASAVIDTAIVLARAAAPIVQTLQANLRRSERDAERLVEAGVAVRLVKGAYVEPRDIAHPWGEPTDIAFVRLAHQLHQGNADLSLGTHDPIIRESLLAALSGIRIEMLLGVRDDDAVRLVAEGHHVRVYVPYGDQWFRYWMRRLAESRGN